VGCGAGEGRVTDQSGGRQDGQQDGHCASGKWEEEVECGAKPGPPRPWRRKRASHLGLRKKAMRQAGHGQQRESGAWVAALLLCEHYENAPWSEEEDEESKKKRMRGSDKHRRKIDFC